MARGGGLPTPAFGDVCDEQNKIDTHWENAMNKRGRYYFSDTRKNPVAIQQLLSRRGILLYGEKKKPSLFVVKKR